MNRKSMKITLISILISSTLFNMTNNTLANTEDDIEESNSEEYIEEQSEEDEFEESTYESENDTYEEESTEETYETFNQTTVIEKSEETAGTGQDSENEEGSSVPDQETYEANNEKSDLDGTAEDNPVNDSGTETESDDEILVPEEDFGGDSPEEPSEEPDQNNDNRTGDNGGSEENPGTVPEDEQNSSEEQENDNSDNEQTEPENNEDINDDVNENAPIEEAPEPDENTGGTGEIDAGDGSGGEGSSEGGTEAERQEPGTGNEVSDDGNTEDQYNPDEQNDEDQQGQPSEPGEGDLPYGSGGAASGPNDQEADYGASDTDEATQTDRVIEGGHENGGEEQQTEVQQNKKSGVAGNKLYRYDYGDILNGIDLRPGTAEENYSTLDKRVNRIMTSKIVEEDDMTAEEILELEEEIKNESGVVSSTRDTLPDTGETNQYNYLYSFMLILSGGILFFLTKRPGNE